MQPAIASTFLAGYDAKGLTLRIVVEDRTPSGDPNGRKSWEQDGLELFFDTRPDLLEGTLAEAQHLHGKVGRIFVSPYETPDRRFTVEPRDLSQFSQDAIRCQVSPSAAGYTVELVVPWEALELSGPMEKRCLGFELAVNDAVGGEAAAFQQTWNSWGSHYRDRLSFGIMRFAK